jgi:hypothetical protein
MEVEECRELDYERVLVLQRHTGRGKASGLEIGRVRTRGAGIFHIRAEQVTRIGFYLDAARALADLGVAPETGPPGSYFASAKVGTGPSAVHSPRRRLL